MASLLLFGKKGGVFASLVFLIWPQVLPIGGRTVAAALICGP